MTAERKNDRIEIRVTEVDKQTIQAYGPTESGEFSRWVRDLLLGRQPHPKPEGGVDVLTSFARHYLSLAIKAAKRQKNPEVDSTLLEKALKIVKRA